LTASGVVIHPARVRGRAGDRVGAAAYTQLKFSFGTGSNAGNAVRA
jgi:hypothetical protein